jgi:hypothetical protein
VDVAVRGQFWRRDAVEAEDHASVRHT